MSVASSDFFSAKELDLTSTTHSAERPTEPLKRIRAKRPTSQESGSLTA